MKTQLSLTELHITNLKTQLRLAEIHITKLKARLSLTVLQIYCITIYSIYKYIQYIQIYSIYKYTVLQIYLAQQEDQCWPCLTFSGGYHKRQRKLRKSN